MTDVTAASEELFASPCVGICTLDRVAKICIGCLRTMDEIGRWRVMSLDEKRAVVAACATRAEETPPRTRDGKPLEKR